MPVNRTDKLMAIAAISLLEICSLVLFFLAYQTGISMNVIDYSLTRHAEQFLIERSTQASVMRELEIQNLWLWISGIVMNIASFMLAFTFIRKIIRPPA